MKKLPKEKRDRLIMIAVGTVVIATAAWYLLIQAQNRKLSDIAKQAAEQAVKVSNAQRLVTSMPEIQKGLEGTKDRLKSIEETMASGDMYSWIILTINRFKADHKVDISQFSREVATEVGMYSKFPYKAVLFHVRGNADFHDLGKFLADFENTFSYMRVQNLELEPAASSSATSTGEAYKLAFKLEVVALMNPNLR